ncbi:glycerophosphodiester phosphodiesterase family protein [Cryocola sp. 340MFSha3.1]|uniref:glycerophosphodiester phosphodiesterase family protein n=1 Tax=Cryocola sp. 340MFSha3.1 TaxID=1169145 RepID=UPI000369E96F|nr:glycerophosphodiester phosphodiesterase family protein [Cryocola sp. 340MFSha3.1]
MTFLDGAGTRIIAHRGLALDAPENTLLAFLRALSAGATHLETDIHASADGVAVIAHDPDLARVAGRNVNVGQLTMTELRRIELGHGQGFCSLAEALDAFPQARFNIDVKDARAAAPAVAAIRDARATGRVLITSFSSERRRAVADALPGVASSPAVSEFFPALIGARLGIVPLVHRALRGFVAVQVPERRGPLRIVTRRVVERIHAAGAEVHVWTVNDPADMVRLLDLGADGIVTDRCDILKSVVASRT